MSSPEDMNKAPTTAFQKFFSFLFVIFFIALLQMDNAFYAKLIINPKAASDFICKMEPYTSVVNFLIRPSLLVHAQQGCLSTISLLDEKLLYFKFKLVLSITASIFFAILIALNLLIDPTAAQKVIEKVRQAGGILKFSKKYFKTLGISFIITAIALIGFPLSQNVSAVADLMRSMSFFASFFLLLSIMGTVTWIISILLYSFDRRAGIKS